MGATPRSGCCGSWPRSCAGCPTVATRLLEEARVAVENLTLDVSLSTPAKPSASGASARPAKVVERTVSVTISAGVAENETAGVDPKEMIEAAEQALQRARQAGMNRVAR